MDKLLVIGASGLLGSKVLELGKHKYTTYGTYNTNKKDGLIKINVIDKKKVFSLINRIKPTIIFDTHTINNVDYCETHKEEAWDINVEGSKNVAKASKSIGAKYVFISSDYIFSGKKRIYTENDKPDPLNYLGRTKWAVESLIEILDIDSIVARTSGLYGAQSSTGKKSFIQWVIESLKNKERINVVSDQNLSFTLVDDLVNSLFSLIESGQKGTFNIVGKDCISKYEFAMQISKEFNLNSSLISKYTTSKLSQVAKRPKKVRLSTKKLMRVIHKTPAGVDEGIRKISRL